MFFFVFGLMWLLTVTSYFTRSQLGSNFPTIAHFPSPFRSTRACVYHCYNYAGFLCFVFSLSSFFCLFGNKECTFCVVKYTPVFAKPINFLNLVVSSPFEIRCPSVFGKRFNAGDEPINTYLLVEQVSSVGACVK